jgi:soluble lytic murein transglycosylase-like protein
MSMVAHADIYIDDQQQDAILLSNIASTANQTVLIAEYVAKPASNLKALDLKTLDPSTKSKYDQFHSIVRRAAEKTALPPALIHAVIKVESNYNGKASSKKGAKGLMQLMPATAKQFSVNDVADADQNVLAGSRYLKKLYTQFDGDLTLTLAAYNAGPASVIRYGAKIPPYRETAHYVPKVLSYYQQFKNLD